MPTDLPRITIVIPPKLKQQSEALADYQGSSLAALIRRLLQKEIYRASQEDGFILPEPSKIEDEER